MTMARRTRSSIINRPALDAMLAEHAAVYRLAEFRMQALDRRVPVAGAVITAFVGAIPIFSPPTMALVLISIPIAIVWFVRTTLNHARSFEDALRRIEQIELLVNRAVKVEAMTFQSSHPSRGRSVGGRTGMETVSTALSIAAIMLGGCLFMAIHSIDQNLWFRVPYFSFVVVICFYLIRLSVLWRRYAYQPSKTGSV